MLTLARKMTSRLVFSIGLLLIVGNAALSAETEWQAAKSGAPVDYWALYTEAVKYQKGGIEQKRNLPRARDLFLKIARGPNREAAKWAYYSLGGIYARPPLFDTSKAKRFYQSAVDMGELWSAGSLIELYGKEPRTKANRAKMLRLVNLMLESDKSKIRQWARRLAKLNGLAVVSD
jgi:hypothetical protein